MHIVARTHTHTLSHMHTKQVVGRSDLLNEVNDLMSTLENADTSAKVVAIDGPQGTGKTLVTDRIKRTAGAYFK